MSGSIVRRAVAALLVAAGSSGVASGETAAVVEARVQTEDGRPLAEAWVWVVWDRGAPVRFEPGRRRVLNPKGWTGSDGRLKIEIPAGFFGPGEPLALAWEQKQEGRSHLTALHRLDDGERLVFRLGEAGPEADFGRLIAPEPRPE